MSATQTDFEQTALQNIGRIDNAYLTSREGDKPEVGEIVIFFSRGSHRTGVVTKVGRKNVQVLYATEGGVKQSTDIYYAQLNRDASQVAKSAAGSARSNHAYFVREINPDTAQHHFGNGGTYSGQDAPSQSYYDQAAIPVEDYVQAHVDDAVERCEAGREHAKRVGPLGYVHFTTKSVAIDKLFVTKS